MPGQSAAPAINASKETSYLPIYLVQLILLPCVFAIDMVTRLGLAEWMLYLVPLGLCVQQPRAHLAFMLAGVCTALMVLGYVLSPPGADPIMAAINRAIGTAVLWFSAFFIRQVILARTQVQGIVWMQQGEALVAQSMLGEQSVAEVGANALKTLAGYLDAQVGVLYVAERNALRRIAGFALDTSGADAPEHLAMGQGIAGQVAAEQRAMAFNNLPAGYLSIRSALGQTMPQRLLAVPVIADRVLVGVLELGLLRPTRGTEAQLELLKAVTENIGVALRSALYRQQLVELLQQTQRQSEELQVQQEELQVSNEELEEQARSLEASQVQLENQQAELEQTNVRLEEQAQDLERQKDDLLRAQQALNLNAEKLESANRYKSEFLANMSHELRTPLNSSLILAKILIDNKDGNLNADQVEYARTIQASNNDLLHLINEILDLSKIESGHVEVAVELVTLEDTLKRLRAVFEPLAQQKGVDLVITAEPRAPATMLTDPQRLEQILKNLLSNALKFTEQGQVNLKVQAVRGGRIAFAVRDTGVGIAPHQQEVIFEAFRQADGTTSRRYGGTGLGLSISRELAHLLGGDITVDSALGQGSTFTLELPLEIKAQAAGEPRPLPTAGRDHVYTTPAQPLPAPSPAQPSTRQRDTDSHADVALKGHPPSPSPHAHAHAHFQRKRANRLILAVEDDPHFARVLSDMAEELDFDCVLAGSGGEALQLARELQPDGILMDIGLPDQSGLSVLEQLKRDTATRHIPVHMISLHDRIETSLQLGAIGHAVKPVAREELAGAIHKLENKLRQQIKHVLVVEDDATLRANITLLLRAEHIDIHSAGTVAGALEQLSARTFDCVVMDLTLPDGTGYDLLEKMAQGDKFAFPPVIVYTGRALTREDEQRLRRYSKSIIIKGARSPERLLDEVTLFLHSVESSLPPDQQRLLRQARQRDAAFDGRHILLVEDDVRNIFALSKVLEPMGAQLAIARNGKEALSKLADMPEIDLVLMDIMMPEMDGLTAMKLIRERPAWTRLPIIALTAKAMADDRAACLAAGADDYIAKPIDVERLLSLCRVWMTR